MHVSRPTLIAALVGYALVMLVILYCAAQAIAYPRGHHADPLRIAQTAWVSSPCTEKLSIHWTHAIAANGEAGSAEDIDTSNDRFDIQGCTIALDPVYYHQLDYREKLTIMLHEAGHYAGLQHTNAYNHIMRADHNGCIPLCRLINRYDRKRS